MSCSNFPMPGFPPGKVFGPSSYSFSGGGESGIFMSATLENTFFIGAVFEVSVLVGLGAVTPMLSISFID